MMTSSPNSSPCTEYTVGDLIEHVDQVSRGATALAHHTAGLPGSGTGPDAAHLDPGWRDSAAQHLRELGEAWDDPAAWQGSANVPGSDFSNEMWGKITLTELVMHGWDIASSRGLADYGTWDCPAGRLKISRPYREDGRAAHSVTTMRRRPGRKLRRRPCLRS
jgi:uncharacterized protein (TIGR03086 family)